MTELRQLHRRAFEEGVEVIDIVERQLHSRFVLAGSKLHRDVTLVKNEMSSPLVALVREGKLDDTGLLGEHLVQ